MTVRSSGSGGELASNGMITREMINFGKNSDG